MGVCHTNLGLDNMYIYINKITYTFNAIIASLLFFKHLTGNGILKLTITLGCKYVVSYLNQTWFPLSSIINIGGKTITLFIKGSINKSYNSLYAFLGNFLKCP